MSDPAETLECPRCRRPTLVGHGEVRATSYRSITLDPPKRFECSSCAVVVLRMPEDAIGAIDEHLDQQRAPSDLGCPFCLSALDRLVLRSATAWVEIERCPRCHALLLDDGEGPLLRAIITPPVPGAPERRVEDLSERRANVAGVLRQFGMSLEPNKGPSWTADRRAKADAALADLETKLRDLFDR